MELLLESDAADLSSATRVRAQAEAAEWSQMLEIFEAGESTIRAAADLSNLLRDSQIATLRMNIGRAMKLSEGQVSFRLAAARRVRDHTPAVWAAFSAGCVDASRVHEIAGAIEKLERATSIARLDGLAVRYAETHTLAELRRWLKLFIARVEADLFNERAEAEFAKRRVDIDHDNDGMGWFNASHGSHVMAAIDHRLSKEAKALGADDPRTMDQRRADLFASWMTTGEATEPAISAHIAITVPGSAIAGGDQAPAVAADESWVVPTDWMLDLAQHDPDNTFWHRMVLDPITDDVLSHEYIGRFAPKILAQAIEFRDGTCRSPGCCKPASQCDIDHRKPHGSGGPTVGWNLQSLCRRHHRAKGYGLLAVP